MTSIKRDLGQIEDELEQNGLAQKGKGKGKQGESEVQKQIREIGESYDRLVGMMSEDEAGREKAKTLLRQPCVPSYHSYDGGCRANISQAKISVSCIITT